MRTVALDDKYTLASGSALMNGTQALVRLPMLQRSRDIAAGLNTAGFISGYRGSPLGNYDLELWRAREHLERHDIVFQPGVNEDLAATAVWGTQMLAEAPKPNKDGVFAIWYAKAPGLDRSGDPLRHGNAAGSHPNGGVLVVVGDDHSGKSSSVASQSEFSFVAAEIPILAPSNVQDILEFGLFGFAMSRYTGLYIGFKTTNDVMEHTMVVEIPELAAPILPDRGTLPPEGIHYRSTHIDRQRSDTVLKRYRWPLVERFVRANSIDRVLIDAQCRRLGIVASGKAVQDVKQALISLDLTLAKASALGVSFYKVGCIYPLERQGLFEFAAGQTELLFVEEKAAFIESQAKTMLYGRPSAPRIVGKSDEEDGSLIPSDGLLEPIKLALVIAERLRRLGVADDVLVARADELGRQIEATAMLPGARIQRAPYFCSGCPHNTSTRTPEGSISAGGIGCHAMAMYGGPAMLANSQMGGEGAHWYSLAKFSDTPHIFQNMGDGTYYHSGLLAVRGAVAARVNITFRILYNDAVAMTGGQPVDGPLSVADVAKQVLAEGVEQCVVVTDRPDLYGRHSNLAQGVKVLHRDEYDSILRKLREMSGVTVVIYEQTCAAEKRRRRKKGTFPNPAKRMFINPAVCEGCGDCSVQSNCVSIWPEETELGRKRTIDQLSCNKDYSCAAGFCPSFVTILGAEPRKPSRSVANELSASKLPPPPLAEFENAYNIMISGIGGTGVVTVGALLGMAAHLDGKACSIFDMTGLSVKNGSVFSHVRIARETGALGAQKLGTAEAHLALAFDAVAALSAEPAVTLAANKTRAIVNSRVTPTPGFQRNPDLIIDPASMLQKIREHVLDVHGVDASGLALALLGDTIAANLLMLGFASQLGLLPVSAQAIRRAVEINGVEVALNQLAFDVGRLQAADPELIDRALRGTRPAADFRPITGLEEILAHRMNLLANYQDFQYAERYRRLVTDIATAETKVAAGRRSLAVAVARNFAKLMAYKDEYEVARLYNDPAFKDALKSAFGDGMKLRYNLAPPLFTRRDAHSGHLKKREYGAWLGVAFKVLAPLKVLRGTPFDPFGYTAERKMERQLIDRYEAMMGRIASKLAAGNYQAAIELAELPASIRGFGHIKDVNIRRALAMERQALARFDSSTSTATAAAAIV
jgi:indolepyruvate ferredoxin oxidoreductase